MRIFLILSSLYFYSSAYALINGEAAEEGQFPATLFFSNCTATRIGPSHILTAAHCIESKMRPETMLSLHYGAKNHEAVIEELEIEKVFVQESYLQKKDKGFDIAIIKFKSNLPDAIQIARVSKKTLKKGNAIILAGYGITSPGLLERKILDGGTLTSSQSDLEADLHFAPQVIDSLELNRFKTRAKETEPRLGRGDSGGAVFLASDSNHLTIVGINSGGNILSHESYFTRLDEETKPDIYQWIEEKLK